MASPSQTAPQLEIDFSRGHRNPVSKKVHAEKVAPTKQVQWDKILFLVGWAPLGLTCGETAEAMGIEPESRISGRFSEMGKDGFQWLHVTGTRLNKRGNPCGVYELTELGKAKLAEIQARRRAVVIG